MWFHLIIIRLCIYSHVCTIIMCSEHARVPVYDTTCVHGVNKPMELMCGLFPRSNNSFCNSPGLRALNVSAAATKCNSARGLYKMVTQQ